MLYQNKAACMGFNQGSLIKTNKTFFLINTSRKTEFITAAKCLENSSLVAFF